jgi:hypothetical protein
MDTFPVFDVTKQKTVVWGTKPGGGGGGGTVRSYNCPLSSSEVTVVTYGDGDVLELAKSASLCTLVEVDSKAVTERRSLQPASAELGLKPVGRSYSGNDWEPYSGAFASADFDCSPNLCSVSLPVPAAGRTYLLKTYSEPTYTAEDKKARFLEKGTFGPTWKDIGEFVSNENWVSAQLGMENMTSHRAFFRERLTHWHTETSYHTLLHTNPCTKGARYRKYAFLPTDNGRWLTITTSPYGKKILSVDGVTRTVVSGPIGAGGSSTIEYPDLNDGKYQFCLNNDLEGVHTEVLIRPTSSSGCKDLWVNGIYGNPTVQFDANHSPDNLPITLDGNYVPVINDRFVFSDVSNNLLQLTSDVTYDQCSGIVPGAPEAAYVGTITDGTEIQYYLHSATFTVQENTLEQPLLDGGKAAVTKTESALFERMQVVCSNAPRTYLNEDHCVLSDDGCVAKEGTDVDIELSLETLESIYHITGGGGPDTLYGKYRFKMNLDSNIFLYCF